MRSEIRSVIGLTFTAAVLAACGTSQPELTASTAAQSTSRAAGSTATDPAAAGVFAAADEDYNFGRMTVMDEQTSNTYESDIHGYIRYPQDQAGPFPVLLFVHGRHQTCETSVGQAPVLIADDDACPNTPVVHPAMSYRGYDYLVENLASHGYAVISIDANDINDSDGSPNNGDSGAFARAQLAFRHLEEFRLIDQAGGNGFDELIGKLDFSKVGVMGHSRGGDGVTKLVEFNRDQALPFNIEAVFALAPTDYNTQIVDNTVFATLLPYCDGDVEDLMGAFNFDNARYADPNDETPKFQLISMGSNHNYFNTVWTSDDWEIHGTPTDSFCGRQAASNKRDDEASQRDLGLFFMASFFRYFIGDEAAFAGYWSGQMEVPDNICPDDMGPCADRYHLTVHAPASQRLTVDDTLDADSLTTNNLGGAVTLTGFSDFGSCTPDGRPGRGCEVAEPTFQVAPQLYLSWDAPATYRSELLELDVTAFDVFSVRMGVSHGDADNTDGQDLHLALVDSNGSRSELLVSEFSQALYYPPGDEFYSSGSRKTMLSAIDIPLTAFSGIDLTSLQAVELKFDVTPAGTVQLTDVLFQAADL